MPFETFNQPQQPEDLMAKKPKVETTPDAVEELVRRTKVYQERYRGSLSTEAAAGLALADHYGNESETPGLLKERARYLKLILAELKPATSPSRRRYGGSVHLDRMLPKDDQ
jgi:hypothetical protein